MHVRAGVAEVAHVHDAASERGTHRVGEPERLAADPRTPGVQTGHLNDDAVDRLLGRELTRVHPHAEEATVLGD
jgi:hypothetical protein